MSAKMRMVLTVPTSNQTMIDRMRIAATSPRSSFNRIASYFMAIAGGPYAGSMVTASGAVQASGTVTFSSIAAADTVTVGVTVFTGTDGTPGSAGFQTNATPSAAADIVAATSLAAKINANTTTSKLVTASASGAIVTLTCQVPGLIGNFFPIAISAHGSVSGTGKLASGAEDANITISNGY